MFSKVRNLLRLALLKSYYWTCFSLFGTSNSMSVNSNVGAWFPILFVIQPERTQLPGSFVRMLSIQDGLQFFLSCVGIEITGAKPFLKKLSLFFSVDTV